MSKIKILDACCGSRMFWFDKNESHTIFMDIRQETFEIHGKKVNVDPDVIGDFRDMPFGDNTLFDKLDKLPKPDLIIASPPCESWSNASAMCEGNACWKQEDLSDSLFAPQREPSMFTIRNASDYEKAYINYQYDRQFMKRVNGEL